MLEQMRKQGASIFVYLIFCLLIAIFVINFRPGQSRNDDNGCSGTSNVVLSVNGNEATQTAFKMAYSSPYNWGTQKSKIHIALETLIRRELLASEAETRGLMVNEDLIMEQIKKGRFFSATPPPPNQPDDVEAIYRPIRKAIQGVFNAEDGHWDIKAFKGWVAQLNISQNAYIEEQRRSMLASMMADILMEGVQVSKEEALTQFRYENDTATYDVVSFKPETYRTALRMTEADVDRYLKDHGDDVSAHYTAFAATYKATKPALKLRQIFIAATEKAAEAPKATDDKQPADAKKDDKPADKTADKKDDTKKDDTKKDDTKTADAKKDDAKKDDKKTADAKKVKPVGMPIEEAKAKLEAVRTAATANKQKFVDAAKELNTDENAKAVAGDIGWHTIENAALGDKAVNDAVKALKPGEMTPVIATDKGAFLVIADDKREGDLTLDQVKREIAWEMAKDVYSKEAAKRAALAALTAAQGKKLADLYEKAPSTAPGGMDLEQMLEDPNVPETTKQKIRQLMRQPQHGALEVPEKDTPAGWFETQDKAGSAVGSAAPGSAAPAGSAAPVPAGSAFPTTPVPAGSGAGSAAGAPPPVPPAPPADLTPSKDQLPAMSEIEKPHVDRFGPRARAKQMSGLGQSKEAITAVFEDLHAGDLAKKVYEAEGAFVVVQLVDRRQPDVKEFDKDADRRVAELRTARAQAFLDDWMRERCEALAKDNKIKPNPELLVEHDDNGKLLPVTYRPCMSFH